MIIQATCPHCQTPIEYEAGEEGGMQCQHCSGSILLGQKAVVSRVDVAMPIAAS